MLTVPANRRRIPPTAVRHPPSGLRPKTLSLRGKENNLDPPERPCPPARHIRSNDTEAAIPVNVTGVDERSHGFLFEHLFERDELIRPLRQLRHPRGLSARRARDDGRAHDLGRAVRTGSKAT